MKIFSVQEMIDAERAADASGHSYAVMMELAGRGFAQKLIEEADVWTRPVVVLVGPGNNGGDGLVAARVMAQQNIAVSVFMTHSRSEADLNHQKLLDLGVQTITLDEFGTVELLEEHLARCGVIVDALLGTGANRPITGVVATVLELAAGAIYRDQKFVAAIDCPSGMNCDTGTWDALSLSLIHI